MVLELVEIAGLGADAERDLSHLAGGVRVVRGELAALLRDLEAAPASGEHDSGRVELVLAARGAPAVLALLERGQRAVREERAAARLERVAQRLGDRVAGAVADLEQALGARAAAAGEPVAAVLSA